ncbi:TIM-barrel domain-containing protein [Cryptosporangium phraense]|uniref:Glycoside hydrolase family 31 protein n=1 Tax=Cryptosporangium phraense TaxID=2593070 RepID=A0A545AY72_9ACTN|nr:TIM-barrel domain-containing protein [Cryptosporangium phraense]TQS46263.1 glycoside hydrolase family 31 protein [Cryptosporangium phraense]
MSFFSRDGDALEVRFQREVLRIEPWGVDSVRVRAAREAIPAHDVGALDVPPPARADVRIEGGRLVNGEVTVTVDIPEDDGFPFPIVRFSRTSTGEELLSEDREHFWWPGARVFYGNRSGAGEVHQQFKAYPGERLYGMGQRTHGRLDHKGLALDLIQRNAEVNIPFVLSNRGYGFLWNNPAVGRVEFADNCTRWTATQARAIDYFFTVGSPAEILSHYADATGHAPRLPEWASGFWQCKLRYRDQEELLEVAREHRRRGLPLSVIVADFFHWTAMGDYRFDPAEYPDVDAMMKELDELGVKLMVSIWPTISPLSENFETMRDNGMLLGADQGVEFFGTTRDKGMPAESAITFSDPSNPATRAFVWDVVKRNYYDKGVRVWWLDACEPEIRPAHPGNLVLHAGPGAETINIYPRDTARMFYEGMQSTDDPDTVLLCRSAWAGQQKYSAAVWSGDIPATWESLRQQVRAGLSIAIAGIPWWTTDIGGFHGGDARDEEFRELVVRWFQYGVFCPLFRLHGNREPRMATGWEMTGGPNEVWAFGDEAYEIIKSAMFMRERLRPYLHEQLDRAASDGLPAMRPLFVDYPSDAAAWDVEDQFLFGPDVLVAPVLAAGARSRSVYLPAGTRWTHVWSGRTYEGGSVVEADAPLDQIPVYLREGASVPVAAG